MGDNNDYVRAHYNQHVDLNRTTEQALHERKTGLAAPLKHFHNEIKRRLIRRFAYRTNKLLDLCCGRGGDLHKWKDAEVQYVRGLDIADQEVAEARKRYQELVQKSPDCPMKAEFDVCSTLGEEPYNDGNQYDVVTCMFALHYFYDTEHRLKIFLRNVANSLRDGGFFIATCADGKRVMQHLLRDHFVTRMLEMKRLYKIDGKGNVLTPFGNKYSCAIKDTVTEGKGESQGSIEYLTFHTPIKHIAREMGLYPVNNFEDINMDKLFEDTDRDQVFKHFKPYFPESDDSLRAASALNMAFVFQKLPKPADPKAEPVTTLPPVPPEPRRGGGGGHRGGGGGGWGGGRGERRGYDGGGGRGGSGGWDGPDAKRARYDDRDRQQSSYGAGPGPGGWHHGGPPPGGHHQAWQPPPYEQQRGDHRGYRGEGPGWQQGGGGSGSGPGPAGGPPVPTYGRRQGASGSMQQQGENGAGSGGVVQRVKLPPRTKPGGGNAAGAEEGQGGPPASQE